MGARPGSYQASLNAGELSPELVGNTGVKQYYSGAKKMLNVEPVPQGGFNLLPRTRLRSPVRRALSQVHLSGPVSGTLSAAGTIATISFASANIAAIDLEGLVASLALPSRLLVVEVFSGGSWVAIGGALAPGTASVARRLARAPGNPVSATQLRLRLTGAPAGATTISLSGIRIWSEAASGVQIHRALEFTVSRNESYLALFTPLHVDFFRDGAFVGACGHAYDAALLPDMTAKQRDETMIIWHRDIAPQRLVRRSVDWEWSLSAAPFTRIPLVDYGATYANVQNERWQVWIRWASGISMPGQDLVITIDGEDTPVFEHDPGGNWTATAAAMKAAIEQAAAVDTGIIVTVVTSPAPPANSQSLIIEFAGGRNPGQKFNVGGRAVASSDIAVTTSRLIKGKKGGEDVMSVARGWPATGNFWQDRLILAGFKAKGGAWAASRPGEYFDLNTELTTAAGGLLFNLDTDGAERIVHIARAAHLVIFTDRAEYFISDRALSAIAAPNVVRSSSIGASSRVPVVEQEGALLYVSREGGIVYAAVYSNETQTYMSEPQSLLSSHLIAGIKTAALQVSNSATDAQRYYLVRDDGLMIVGLLIRNQEITAFVRWATDGLVRDCVVDAKNTVYLTVERQVAGAPQLFLEELQDDLVFDAVVDVVNAPPSAIVGGLWAHEGATVWAIADGFTEGPFVVAGGTIELQQPAANIRVGRWTPPDVEGLPPVREVAPRIVLKRPARIHTLQMDLIETQSLAVGANGKPARDVGLAKAGDNSALGGGYSGEVVVAGLPGFMTDPTWRITQVRPGKLQVRNITAQARV